MIAAMLPAAALAAPAQDEEVLQVLAVMGVMNGDQNGNLNLGNKVTRAEMVKMAIAASTFKKQGDTPSVLSPYPDVKAGSWMSGYITVARDNGIITGYLDGTFRPDNYVTLEETVSIMLKVMGYSGTDFAAGYPAAHMNLYYSLNLDEDMTAKQGQELTRADCAQLVYNSLNSNAKGGKSYATTLGYSVDSNGKINYADLTLSVAKGPVMNDGGKIESLVGFTPITVYRDRRASSLSELKYGDVLYYVEEVRGVWAYSAKVSGVVQKISPSTVSPTSVTVSGVTVALGTSSVIRAFSDLGTVKVGDNVSLLLGVGGSAVFVLTGEAASQTVYGVVTSVGLTSLTDEVGSAVQGKYLTMTATNGSVYSYPYSGSGYKAGDIVKVSVSGGNISFARAKSNETPSGTVKNGKLGQYKLTNDTEIVDYLTGRTVTVTNERLEGVSIAPSKVSFCVVDENNNIEKMVLANVTGDCMDYGVATTVSKTDDLMSGASTYVYIVNGVTSALNAQTNYAVKKGPCAIQYDGMKVKSMSSLTGKAITDIGAFEITLSGGDTMRRSTNIQVYLQKGDDYYLSSMNSVSLDTHKLTGYYDKETSQGGAVRVIIASEK